MYSWKPGGQCRCLFRNSCTPIMKPAKVAGREFILPAHYLLHFEMVRGFAANEAEYTGYRRFSADTTIQFEGETR